MAASEDKVEKLLKSGVVRRRERAGRVGCPDEESVARYLAGTLAGEARDTLEAHLAQCSFCLDETVAAYKAMEDTNVERVPQRVLNKALGLVKEAETLFDIVVRFVKDSIELVSSPGFAMLTPVPVAVRGADDAGAEKVLQLEKELGRLKLALELEQAEAGLCRIAARLVDSDGKPVDGVRVSLVSGNRERASFLTRGGEVAFDGVSQGDYSLALSDASGLVGTIKLSLVS